MRKYNFLLIAFLLVFALSSSAKTKRLLILHTNDTHSCIYPLNKQLADTAVAGRGGYLRRLSMIEQERKENPKLLLIDSGDFSQGSPYYTLFKGDVEIGLMNRMGYDAATVGNHEFDFGLENMARLFRMARFPIVCANYDFTGTPVEGTVKPYVIIKRDGLKIGIIGVAPKLKGLVDDRKDVGVKFLDPAPIALKLATMLKTEEHCDLVICISHLGWHIGGMDDEYLIGNSRNIDIVLGGHSHTYFHTLKYAKNLDGKSIPVDQNGKQAIYVGKINLTLDSKK